MYVNIYSWLPIFSVQNDPCVPSFSCFQGCCWRSCSNWFKSTVWITRIHCSQPLCQNWWIRWICWSARDCRWLTPFPPVVSWKMSDMHYHQTDASFIRIGPSWWRPCGLCVQKLCWKAVKSLAFRVPHEHSTKESIFAIFVTRSYLVEFNLFYTQPFKQPLSSLALYSLRLLFGFQLLQYMQQCTAKECIPEDIKVLNFLTSLGNALEKKIAFDIVLFVHSERLCFSSKPSAFLIIRLNQLRTFRLPESCLPWKFTSVSAHSLPQLRAFFSRYSCKTSTHCWRYNSKRNPDTRIKWNDQDAFRLNLS